MEDELYTVSQTAQYLQLCEKTVRRLIKSQKILASKVGERSLRIRKADIDNYLADNINKAKGVKLK